MVAEAEKFGITVCVEGVDRLVIHDVQSFRRMLNALPSDNLQILFDPVNLLNAQNYTSAAAVIEEALSSFGERIAVFHMKDFVVENGMLRRVPIGEGVMDFLPLLRYIKENKPYVNVIVEEYWPEGAVKSLQYLKDTYAKL